MSNEAIYKLTGHHYDVAEQIEALGYQVEMDADNNERSLVATAGPSDFGERVVAEILGDAEAIVRPTRGK